MDLSRRTKVADADDAIGGPAPIPLSRKKIVRAAIAIADRRG